MQIPGSATWGRVAGAPFQGAVDGLRACRAVDVLEHLADRQAGGGRGDEAPTRGSAHRPVCRATVGQSGSASVRCRCAQDRQLDRPGSTSGPTTLRAIPAVIARCGTRLRTRLAARPRSGTGSPASTTIVGCWWAAGGWTRTVGCVRSSSAATSPRARPVPLTGAGGGGGVVASVHGVGRVGSWWMCPTPAAASRVATGAARTPLPRRTTSASSRACRMRVAAACPCRAPARTARRSDGRRE